jgi:lipoprotein-releasing system permease protein
MPSFETTVARRYLLAKRGEKVIPVITVISIAGVAAGVMALVIALAVNNGFRGTLQRSLLGATSHIDLLEKEPGEGIADWRQLTQRLKAVPHVTGVSAVIYDKVMVSGPRSSAGAILKGVDVHSELATNDLLRHLKTGDVNRLVNDDNGLPGAILGARLADDSGVVLNSIVTFISPQGNLTPMGPSTKSQRFRVVGIFESGFYELDQAWAYAPMASVQRILGIPDVVNQIELRIDDLNLAGPVGKEVEKLAGPRYVTVTWQEKNKGILNALKMERIVTAITIGLIELVGALNILITLTLIVLTRHKDIGVLMAMGARRAQIRRIFVLQGLMIGTIGTVAGLITGYLFCYFANTYRWIPLDESVYALSFVPFEPGRWDGLWVALAALAVSLAATLYPARNATNVTPVEVLRYE